MEQQQTQGFRARMGRIEGLIASLDGVADPAVQHDVRMLVQELLTLHADGLNRLCEHAYEAAGQPLIDALAQDDQVGGLLLLHGLHPLPIEMRVMQALNGVRPYLGSHGGDVELLGVTPEGVVRLRLEGSCEGCPSSQATLRYTIEEAVYDAAPDATALEVEGAVEAPPAPVLDGFIPISEVTTNENGTAPSSKDWETVTGLRALDEGEVQVVDVSGQSVLFCRVDGRRYAYDPTCPACTERLAEATLDEATLTCPACGHHYDVVHAGRSLESPSLHLTPFPLLEKNGHMQVKVLEAAGA